MTAHWPQTKPDDGVRARVEALFGSAILSVTEHAGETTVLIVRDAIVDVVTGLRDDAELAYDQLMDLSGADYPERVCRFDVNYHLLSLTKNRRHPGQAAHRRGARRAVADVALPRRRLVRARGVGLLRRPIFDGNPDLRRILTDYGFQGHPFRKDFPLTGYVELRYSEEHKRVVYEPVKLAQDFRNFDFLSPWEGTDYVLPGDEKAQPAAGAGTPPPPMAAAPKQVAPVSTADKPGVASESKAKPDG